MIMVDEAGEKRVVGRMHRAEKEAGRVRQFLKRAHDRQQEYVDDQNQQQPAQHAAPGHHDREVETGEKDGGGGHCP